MSKAMAQTDKGLYVLQHSMKSNERMLVIEYKIP